MVKIPTKPPVWVARPEALRKMVQNLSGHSRVAIDTESNSLYAYQEQVCLIQISVPDTDYLLDPLALPDLSILEPLMADPQVEKIFHAAEYDLICLKRDFGFEVNHIFDTMQAGRILGRKEVGLASMLKNEFGLQLEKRYQRANWGARPLTPAMLAYARLDSHYLIDLRDRLAAELTEKGLSDLAEEDFAHLIRVGVPNNDTQPNNCWRLASGRDLSLSQCAVLQALLDFRDRQAQRINTPPFKVLSNQTLIDIATASPRTGEQLIRCTHLSKPCGAD
jgi:ribonuclease D